MNKLLSVVIVFGIITMTASLAKAELMTTKITEVTSTRDSQSDPVFLLDLGADRTMGGIAFTNSPKDKNAVSAMKLRFATEAETTKGFGTSIADKKFTLSLTGKDFIGREYKIPPGQSQPISFGKLIKARYIELTLTDNFGGNKVAFDNIQINSELPRPPAKPRRANFIFEPEFVPALEPTKYIHMGSPAMIELRSGRILLACGGGLKPKATPRMFISDDRGRTFKQIESYPHFMTKPTTLDLGAAVFLRLADGRIALLLARGSPASKGMGGGLPALSFSSDEGKTWTEPVMIGSPEDDGPWYVMNMIQTSSGRLVVAAAFGAGSFEGHSNHGYCFFSDDLGKTWKKSTKPARFSGIDTHGIQEPSIVECKDGSLLMLARTGRGSLHKSLSTDGGLSWSKPEPTTLISASSPSTLWKMPDGRLFVFYNHAKPVGNGYFPRNPFVFSISDDDGQTWSDPWIVDDETDRNFFNAPALFLKEGILTVYLSQLELQAYKEGRWAYPEEIIPDAWKYNRGKRVLIEYP